LKVYSDQSRKFEDAELLDKRHCWIKTLEKLAEALNIGKSVSDRLHAIGKI